MILSYRPGARGRGFPSLPSPRPGRGYCDPLPGRLGELYAKEAQEDGNRKRSEAARAQHAISNPRVGEASGRSTVGDPPERGEKSSERAAREVGVSPGTVRQVAKVDATDRLERPLRTGFYLHGQRHARGDVTR